MKEYLYDVYMSFTGADRELKNNIAKRLVDETGFKKVYDSDAYCKGQFRQDYMEALSKSKVFLMILSDNLRNDPAVTQTGTLSEVRKEIALACELEARNELNILILCTSEFFRFYNGYDNAGDTLGWLFYTHTRGFSYVVGATDEEGKLTDLAFRSIESRAKSFIESRDAGTPVISQAPKLDISEEKLPQKQLFVGREKEIKEAIDAYKKGKQVVVLSGMGGMGKSRIATEIARECTQEHYFKCPQIVQIQEGGGFGDPMQTIVSAVSYTAEIYENLSYLNEQDKYKRKLKALTDLNENVILIIDNYNNINTSQLHEVVDKLKCRILITTRALIDADSEEIEYISIDRINKEAARELFSSLCGFEAPVDSFSQIYDKVGGHTMTLCIFAKMIDAHKMSIDELILRMDDFDKMEELVDSHGKPDTVLGHLKGLFKVSSFNETALKILRSMSILSDGTITLSELIQTLNLKNRNEINQLIKTGWLELIKGEEDKVYLHPIISQLMQKTLKPTEENVSEMIGFIVGDTRVKKQRLTYSSARAVRERLYYASYVIASCQGTLSKMLWEEYTSIDHLLGDASATEKSSLAIAERMNDEQDKFVALAYSDMIALEQNPTQVAIFDKYLDRLGENARDYKWIMKALSVTLMHISTVPSAKDKLDKIIEKAIDAAIVTEDDFSLYVLEMYALQTSTPKKHIRKIEEYIRRKNKNGCTDGDFLLLKTTHLTINLTKAGNIDECLETAKRMMADSDSYGVWYAIKHPLIYARLNGLVKEQGKLAENDPMKEFFEKILSMGDGIASEGVLDVAEFLNAAAIVYQRQVAKGVTLMSASQAVMNILALVDTLPIKKVQDGITLMVDSIDMEDISIEELSKLQISALISVHLKDNRAIERSYMVYQAISRIRPKGHIDVIQAKINYANNCYNMGKGQDALNVYLEVYAELEERVEYSQILSTVCKSILKFVRAGAEMNVKSAGVFFDKIAKANDIITFEYVEALHIFISAIGKNITARRITLEDESVNFALNAISDVIKRQAECNSYTLIELVYAIHTLAYIAIREKNTEKAMEIVGLLKKIKSKTKSVKNTVRGIYGETYNTVLTVDEKETPERKAQYHIKAIEALVKNRIFRGQALMVFYALMNDFTNISFDSIEQMAHMFTKDKSIIDEIISCAKARFPENEGNTPPAKIAARAKKLIMESQQSFDVTAEQYNKFRKVGAYIGYMICVALKTDVKFTRFNVPIRKPDQATSPKKIGQGIGRNDPCPCGSGKKYKFCCGQSEE